MLRTWVRFTLLACTCASLVCFGAAASRSAEPISLHPDNPHYFSWRGKPTILLTSGEHYGAVLNLEFDFRKYLDTLAADGLNYTRIFTGAYVEPDGAFNIKRNTLAPLEGKFICPWPRSDQPGYAGGGNKFDLTKWDDAYFARLKAFVSYAAEKQVVVEVSLFCPFYEEMQWKISPLNAINNTSNLGQIDRTHVYTLDKHAGLLAVQEALTRKMVAELAGFDNLFFEICNEPYFGGVTIAWQNHIADVIVESERERAMPGRHLIAQNIANKSAKIADPHPAVSIFNFHYATPPETVGLNYGLKQVIGDDETGFRGTADAAYRSEAWEFLLAGGGLYNNLDYSFVVGHEDGTFKYPASQPGGGNAAFRRQMKILGDFMRGFDFIHMRPGQAAIKSVSSGSIVHALEQPGSALAVYVRSEKPSPMAKATVQIDLAAGTWLAQWVDTKTGQQVGELSVSGGSTVSLDTPQFDTDIALRLKRQ